jgi:hypothetical protein
MGETWTIADKARFVGWGGHYDPAFKRHLPAPAADDAKGRFA